MREAGGEPVAFGAFPDDEAALEAAVRDALAQCDIVVLSGGTSKGAGDLSHRIVSRLGAPGVIVHGVALKPGKPLCLAVAQGKPIVVLPGFPTSAIFTFHAFVAPVIRAKAGLPPEAAVTVDATVPVRIPFGARPQGIRAGRAGRGRRWARSHFRSARAPARSRPSRRPTAFSRSMRCAPSVDPGTHAKVTLIGQARAPDLVIAGSHCVALDAVLSALSAQGIAARTIAIGSMGGVAAARRGECDLAPIHLMDPATGVYNEQYAKDGLALVRGWQRMQGIVFRKGDARFEGKTAQDALKAALADPDCIMVNRNAGAGTRILIDQLLGAARPPGYGNQPRSHNAVAAAVAQGRADWGVAIQSGRRDVRPRLPAAVARELRLPAGRGAARTASRRGVPQGAGRSGKCARKSPRSA